MSTLTFIAPESVIPHIVNQVKADIDVAKINAIDDTDIAIWGTPEGTAYVDGQFPESVLSGRTDILVYISPSEQKARHTSKEGQGLQGCSVGS